MTKKKNGSTRQDQILALIKSKPGITVNQIAVTIFGVATHYEQNIVAVNVAALRKKGHKIEHLHGGYSWICKAGESIAAGHGGLAY